MKTWNKFKQSLVTEDSGDEVLAVELVLFMQNNAQLYRRRIQPIQKNLITKMAREQYDSKKAIKAWMYAVDDGIKMYQKEYGDFPVDRGTKNKIAEILAKEFEEEAEDGEYDYLLPKKYQKESVELDEGQRWADKVSIPASKQTTDIIQHPKAKILINVPSTLHDRARFVVIERPLGHKGELRSNQDKVLMATISDPKRGRVKMFAFHGSHVSHQKAMDFAKKHKLVTKEDAKGNPLYAKESILDEGKMKEFWQDIHDELKKAMDKKWYREMQSSNNAQGLDNIIGHTHKQLYGKGDPTPKDIADAIVAKYGRNHKEYMKLSLDMMRRNESVELDEVESLHWSELDKEEREDFLQHSKMSKSLASKKWNQLSRRERDKLTKMIDKSTEGEFTLVERNAPLPKSTNFSIVYSYAGKDHKFVTKLTNIGGKLDRAKKEVRFEFKSAGERTRWRKKNADVIASLEESLVLFDTMYKKKKKNYREMIRGLENVPALPWGMRNAPDQMESIELDEESHWVLSFEFNKPEYTSTLGRQIQNDLDKKFKSYSGSGSGGAGWDVSFNGSKKELEKAKKYVEKEYKKFIDAKQTQFVMDESVELDEKEKIVIKGEKRNNWELFVNGKKILTGTNKEVHDKAVEMGLGPRPNKLAHDKGTVVIYRGDTFNIQYVDLYDVLKESVELDERKSAIDHMISGKMKPSGTIGGKKTADILRKKDEAKDFRRELEKRHAEAIKIIWAIDTTFGRTKWTDSFGNYVSKNMPDEIDTSIDAGWAYHQNRGRGEWFFTIEPRDVVKYSYTGNAKINSSEKSGRLKIGEFTKFISKVWALTKAKNESVEELDELKRDEAEVVFDFKSERNAKQFAKDVENSAVGLANKGVERYKGKYRVVITGMTTAMHKKAIGKYAHKNKGEFSHSSSEVTPKGYGPYKEFVTFPTADGSTHWLDETPANSMGGTFAAGQVGEPGAIAGIDMPLGKKKKKNPKGCEVFSVDSDTFNKCVGKKPKGKRWNKFVNTESDIGKKIRKYSLRNPNRGIIIQDETTGKQVYVRRRWNDNRLKHNKKKN